MVPNVSVKIGQGKRMVKAKSVESISVASFFLINNNPCKIAYGNSFSNLFIFGFNGYETKEWNCIINFMFSNHFSMAPVYWNTFFNR
jgi:hypothetical protein